MPADREVLTVGGRNLTDDEVQLPSRQVQPDPFDSQVRAARVQGEAEDSGVEGNGSVEIGDVDRNVVDARRFHHAREGTDVVIWQPGPNRAGV